MTVLITFVQIFKNSTTLFLRQQWKCELCYRVITSTFTMSVAHAVPWMNWNEWSEVKYNIYSRNSINNWDAIKRIDTWKSRGRLPHAVASTCALRRAEMVNIWCIIHPMHYYTLISMRYLLCLFVGISNSMFIVQLWSVLTYEVIMFIVGWWSKINSPRDG